MKWEKNEREENEFVNVTRTSEEVQPARELQKEEKTMKMEHKDMPGTTASSSGLGEVLNVNANSAKHSKRRLKSHLW